MKELIRARGHDNVAATHESTLEVTTDEYLTPTGDCIIGIEADRAPADFDPDFVSACRRPTARISLTVRGGGTEQTIEARGHSELTFESERSAVLRTSDYVDDRTVAVRADGAACDLSRTLIEDLRAGADIEFELRVDP